MKNIPVSDNIPGAFVPQTGADTLGYARWLICTVSCLVVFGLTMLYSTSYNVAGAKYFQNQLMWAVIGTAAGCAAFIIGYRKLASRGLWLCGFVIILLLSARLFFPEINGASRWIRISLPGMTLSIQPSEFAKIALALFTAKYCTDNFRTFNEIFRWHSGMLPLALTTGSVIGCIFLGEDFGTAILSSAMVFAIMFAAGLYMRYWLVPAFFGTIIALYIYFFDPMRLSRATSFLNPEEVAETAGYQLFNSLLALGSGNWFGIGFMESRLKARYLPEAHTDFILAIVGEELGLAAMLVIVAGYSIFFWFGLKISLSANSRLGMLLGFGLSVLIAGQAIINILVVSGSAPTKGMPAPFISYGGSNMLMCLIATGLLVSIAAETARPHYSEELRRSLTSFLPGKDK